MHAVFRGVFLNDVRARNVVTVSIEYNYYLSRGDYLYKMTSEYEIPFLNVCIKAFGHRFSLSREAAYEYLSKYHAVAFLIDFYDVEHLQSIDETVDDLVVLCQQNGGELS